VLEVHAIETGDHRWRQQEHGDDREDLQDVVLIDAHHAEGGIQRKLHLVAEERCVIAHREHVP
jgi:hypothetical protein